MTWTKCDKCSGTGYVEVTPNPVFVSVPPGQPKKKYRVTGVTEVLGHKPGEVFTATLNPTQEASFLEYGALVILGLADDKTMEDVKAPAEESHPKATVKEEKE